jgi:dTDP-4-amino-4,6-dideoxygalactose transaminase
VAMILCGNPSAQYVALKPEIDAAVQRVLDGGWYILGEEVAAFEAEFAAWLGTRHGIGVANGTEAIQLALAACGIGPGDEVLTVSHTAVATVAAIELAGATPVLVDIDPATFTLDPARLETAITPRTRAILPVHLYGEAADMDAICNVASQHGLRVIEDASQAHGATWKERKVGTLGDIGCFSLYPTKNLGALGDAGIAVTGDDELAGRLRSLREYGWERRFISERPGMNSRLDELQAAVLRVKLRHLDRFTAQRRAIAARYDAALGGSGLQLPARRGSDGHVFHLYVVRSRGRDRLLEFLRSRDIGAAVHYPQPVHRQPAYLHRLPGCDDLPETERAAGEILSLPMYPELSEADQQRVIDAVGAWAKDEGRLAGAA